MNRTAAGSTSGYKQLVDIKGLRDMLSCGAATARKVADEAGAAMKIGKRKLYSVKKIADYIEAKAGIKGA